MADTESTEKEVTTDAEDTAGAEDTAVAELAAEAEEAPAVVEATDAEEAPVAEETADAEEAPVAEETADAEEAPVIEETADIEEAAATEDTADAEEAAAAGDKADVEEASDSGEAAVTGHTYEDLKGKTVVQMREIAEGLGEHRALHGYTTMHKEELLVALCNALGIQTHEHHEVVGINKTEVKAKIRALKQQRDALVEAKDSKQLKLVRARIRRLKRKIHKATV